MEFNQNDVAKLCEIGVVFGQLLEKGKVKPFSDLDEAYEHFEGVYRDWSSFKGIQNKEEEGYITAYANRVLVEKYGV